MQILVVEPYFAGSHKAWAEGYREASGHDVHLATMHGQFWRWRLTGAHVELARLVDAYVADHGRPDVMLATSMVNVPALLAHSRRSLQGVPVTLYMHENQLTYIDASRSADYSYAAINWASMTAADLVVFNSEFHRRSWFDAARRWLGSFPDHRHDDDLDAVEDASLVVPVGVDLQRLDGPSHHSDPAMVLWNHRADADKDPEAFVGAVLALDAKGVDFRVAVCGERFVDSGRVFDPLKAALGDRLVWNGFADATMYAELLRSSDIVVSTARQEFFGIAITEAVWSGAFPLVPDRVVYPERIPERWHTQCLYKGPLPTTSLLWALEHPRERAEIVPALQRHMAQFDWRFVAPRLDDTLAALVGGSS